MDHQTTKPRRHGWYWRRRKDDLRSHWKPIQIPSLDAERIDSTGTYEYVRIPMPVD